MPDAPKCPKCGAELPGNSQDGSCLKCLLGLGLHTTHEEQPFEGVPEGIPLIPETPPASGLNQGSNDTPVIPAITEKAGDRIGRYKLVQLIGEGGMGVVWMAEQQEPVRRKVALKVVKLGMDTKQVIARFEAERQALALMDHPNIAKVLDAGTTDRGRPYFVMELVRGIRFNDYCDQNHLSMPGRLGLFIQICHAVQHAHQKGVIHRDLKPSNILVTLHDGVPVPKVIDFGIAKATSDQRLTDKTLFTAFEQFLGTPAYMSPEQAEMSGLDIDTRTDVYSLGVLLYELLTGRTPFDSQMLLCAGLEEMRRILRETDPPRPSTRLQTLTMHEATDVARRFKQPPAKLATVVRGDLDWIVMKALEKDRNRRYETANAFAMDVQRHLSNEPIIARPPGTFYRFQKFAQRNRLSLGAATAASAFLVLGVLSYVQGVRQEQRKTEAALLEAQENFRLARNAIQHATVVTGPVANQQNGTNDFYAFFLEVYRKARVAQPDDPELRSEYVRLLKSKSTTRWDGHTNIQPKDAEENLDEAILLLESAESRQALKAEDSFLLAQIYQRRVQLWRTSQRSSELGTKAPPLPAEMARLADRALVIASRLATEHPEEEKFLDLLFQLIPLENRSSAEISKHLAIVEKFLTHHPDSQFGLRHARYAHWQLGNATTNRSEACEHFRRTLDFQARSLRAPHFNPNFLSNFSPPGVNSLVVASELLRSNENIDADCATLTNLLTAAEVLFSNDTIISQMRWDYWENDKYSLIFQRDGGAALLQGLRVKIAYYLNKNGRHNAAMAFVKTQLPKLKSTGPNDRDRITQGVRDYLQFIAGISAIRAGHLADGIRQLEALEGPEVLELSTHGEVEDLVRSGSIPRMLGHFELRHLATAALDEARVAIGKENEVRLSLDGWLTYFERNIKADRGRDAQHRVFALIRKAALEHATEGLGGESRSRLDAIKALNQLGEHRFLAVAKLATTAAGNSQVQSRRAWFIIAAIAALKRYAGTGFCKSEELLSDPELQLLGDIPAFRELLPQFDRAYEAANQNLASSKTVDVADYVTLSQAAARGAAVRMSGQIHAARNDEEGFQLWVSGKGAVILVSGYYRGAVPPLLAKGNDLTELVGGQLTFNGKPYSWDRSISTTLDRADAIESFVPSAFIDDTSGNTVAATNVTAVDLGRRLTVVGSIKSIDRWYRGKSSEMRFTGTQKNGFTALLPASQKAAFDRRFPLGPDTIIDATVQVIGVVQVFEGRPQISISDLARLEIVALASAAKPRAANEEFFPQAIPLRDPSVPASLIDLSSYYNAQLDQSWHWGAPGKSDLSALSPGIQKLAGVDFDVRGLIQVGWHSRSKPYTNAIKGLLVERKCQRLHFLHAAVNATGIANGTEVGRYVIHFDNGKTSELPIIIGQQLGHWRRQTDRNEQELTLAWMQTEESAAKEGKAPARLFKTTWENPWPDLLIKSFDFICNHKTAAPFLVAASTEP